MMKIKTLVSLALLMIPILAQAQEDNQPAPSRGEYEELRERVDMMEGDIEKLLGEQDRLKEENARDRLNWSGSYRFNVNFFHLTDTSEVDVGGPTHLEIIIDPAGNPVIDPATGRYATRPVFAQGNVNRKEWLAPSWTHRLKLAMTYDFGESLRFYSQLGVYKYFNETRSAFSESDHGANAYPRDNAFRLERVYLDWFVADWLAISVGRIASPDGPPTELKENTSRRSGWGVQMVNATMDAVMATIYLHDETYLRTFYSPFGAHMSFAVNNDISLFDDQGLDILHSWGALFETGVPRMDESILQLGFMHIPKFSPQNISIAIPGTNLVVSPQEPTGQDLGSFLQASSLVLLKDLFKVGLDLFAAYNFTYINPAEDRMVYEYPVSLDIIDPRTGGNVQNPVTGEPLAAESVQEVQVGLTTSSLGDNSNNKRTGHGVYAGLRYTMPWSEAYPTRLGAELNWGTKYHLAWSHPGDQLLNKLGNKGVALEAYLIQQLVPRHLFCRIGYMQLNRHHVGGFIGPTREVEQKIQNIYLLADLSW